MREKAMAKIHDFLDDTNWRVELLKILADHCPGMDDHEGARLRDKLSILERCGKCCTIYSQLAELFTTTVAKRFG